MPDTFDDLNEVEYGPFLRLDLTKEQAEQLLICLDAGLAWDKNFKQMLKQIPRRLFAPKDRGFMRLFKVRPIKSIKKQIEEKLPNV